MGNERHSSAPGRRPDPSLGVVIATALLFVSALVSADGARGQERRLDPGLAPVLPEVAAPAEVKDYLITAGGLMQGALLGCAGESCTIGGTSVPIAQTVFIGLGVEAPAPPPLTDYMQDQVVLRDGSVQQGRLIGISGANVVTDRGSFARDDVAWLYLFPQPEETAQPDAFGAPEDHPAGEEPIGEPGSPDEGQTTGEPGRPDPATPGPAPSAGEPPGERGALWTGTVHWTIKTTPEHLVTSMAVVRLREVRSSGRSFDLVHEGSTVSVTHSTLGGDDCKFSGGGTSPAEGLAGYIEREQIAGPNGEVSWGPWAYQLTITPAREPVHTTTCPDVAWPGTDRTTTFTYGGTASGSWLAYIGGLGGGSYSEDAEHDWQGPRLLDNGRMSGSYTTLGPYGRSVSWNICREGVDCAAPPEEGDEETAEDDLCPRPTPQQALLDTGLRQQQALVDRLASQIDAYNRLADQARQWQGDFDHATRDCGLWQWARVLTNFLVGNATPANPLTAGRLLGGGAGTAGPMGEAGKELSNFLSMLEKIAAGDASWLLPNYEFNDWASAEDAWEALQFGYGQLNPESDPQRLLDGLGSCGAPTIGPVMDGARTYLRLLQQIEPLMRDSQKTLNDLRQKDLELLDLWNKYQQACLDHAECAGIDPASCNSQP